MKNYIPFHGSYKSEDVTFLLKQIKISETPIHEKEALIQAGARHYSEMISPEKRPSDEYQALFLQTLIQNGERVARDLYTLAYEIVKKTPGDMITIVSLVRAGTPVGVLLKRIIQEKFNKDVEHFSVSIIRDRGIDINAIKYILNDAHRAPESLVFVDGWTGKGVINDVLDEAITGWNEENPTQILCKDLVVLADLAGVAGIAATSDDYLIPSSILNSTVSGLTSRSILNTEYIGEDDFHGCVFYDEFMDIDYSQKFVDFIYREFVQIADEEIKVSNYDKEKTSEISKKFMLDVMSQFYITDRNFVKPGIGEATRVLLRRVPDLLIVQDECSEDVAHLIHLAKEKNIPIEVRVDMPYKALAIIKSVEM